MNEEENKKETEEETAVPSYADAIASLKTEYEEKIAKLEKDAKEKIEERDNIIKSLVLGESKEHVPSVAEIINEKRAPNLKKW